MIKLFSIQTMLMDFVEAGQYEPIAVESIQHPLGHSWAFHCQGMTVEQMNNMGLHTHDDWFTDSAKFVRLTEAEYTKFLEVLSFYYLGR